MGKTPAAGRRKSAMQMPWWAWAWPAAAWGVVLLTAFLHVSGFLAAIAGAVLIATVFAAVYHAEVVAHRTGEPFVTLVLAVAGCRSLTYGATKVSLFSERNNNSAKV